MATSGTVELGAPHEPTADSVRAFEVIETDLKKMLQHMRHDITKHEPEYFSQVDNLTDEQLTDFSSQDLVLVRVGKSAYGIHLFGKVILPDSEGRKFPYEGGAYIHFRAFIGAENAVKLHAIQSEIISNSDGTKTFKAIYTQDDPLVWFDV